MTNEDSALGRTAAVICLILTLFAPELPLGDASRPLSNDRLDSAMNEQAQAGTRRPPRQGSNAMQEALSPFCSPGMRQSV
ncbi:hypothetical protein ACFOY4_01370 [Actinomadura syzygii]|uniref:Uncharacterized protein n=1 Tax=Actinomadura syzygii TaxID=1427538 RepID=A0A5D0TQM2_9ACTN|nr:hypothetical protein [Actinomadura syzygii]TYC08601.1 hypothetical protein FXF65_37545 [Actinomadura syzygii]